MAPPIFSQRGNVMNYAALGDISGAPHEFNSFNTDNYNYVFIRDEHKNPYTKSQHFGEHYKNRCTDDTILSMAIAKSVMEVGDNLDKLEETTTKYLKEFVKLYPNDGITFPGLYGNKFVDWAKKPGLKSMTGRPSFGNGSAMRVSAVGWAYDSLEKTLEAAEKTALPSHGHPEAIKGAQAIASAIYLARAGMSKDDIKAFLETKFDYDLDITHAQYQHYNRKELKSQSETCQTTVPMAICAFLASTDENGKGYEDCVRKAVTLGGDSDTIGAMAGSIAGAFYGLPKDLDTKCESLLNDHLKGISNDFQKFVAARHTEPDKAELAEVMAKARLESYLLQQSKQNNQTPPNQDPKVLDLLAKSEAARLFYEQVKAARQKNDQELAQKLLDNQEDILDAMEQKCKESPDFDEKYHNMTAWPVKWVKIKDVDEMLGKRRAGVPKTLPQRRAQVDHQAVAKLSIRGRDVVDTVLASKIGKYPEAPVKPKRAFLLARPFLSLYHMIKGDYKSFDQKMREYTEDADLVKRITEDLDQKKALRETGQQGRTKDDVERGNEYVAQQRAAAMSEVDKKIEPKFIPAPVDDKKAPETEEKTESVKEEQVAPTTQNEEPTLVNDQRSEKLRTFAQNAQTMEREKAPKEEPTLVNDQKSENLHTLASGMQNAEKAKVKEQVVTHNIDGALLRQIHDVKQTLEINRLKISAQIQTRMRDFNEYSPIQEVGSAFFEQKVEKYLDQVLYGKVQPNSEFLQALDKSEKFDEVYEKWAESADGKAFSEKLFERYSHDDLREAMEASPALKSKLDANAKIYDDETFGRNLISENQKAHQKFLADTLNVATDGEMKKMLTEFSYIEEFTAPAIQAEQSAVQTTEPALNEVAENDVSASAEQLSVPV